MPRPIPSKAGPPVVRVLRAKDVKPAPLMSGRTNGVELRSPKAEPDMPKKVAMKIVLMPPIASNYLFMRRKPFMRE